MPRRVLYVSHVDRLGGAERSLLDLIDALDPSRYVPHVALPVADAPGGELSRALADRGVPLDPCSGLRRLHRHPARLFGQAFAVVRGWLSLWLLERRIAADLVHANSTTAAMFAMALPRPGPPLVWHVRDLAIPAALGGPIGRASARVVTPSRACRDAVAPFAHAIEVVPNGIALPADEPSSSERTALRDELTGGSGEGPLAVSVGQLVPWKGHDLAVEAVALARERVPGLRLAIVGADLFGDDRAFVSRLEARVRDAGLGGAVRLVGWRDDVRAILASADLLLHAAYPEPFGRVVVEAMAAGRPVVAFDGAHGPAEIVRDGVDGILVGERTAEALGRAVVRAAGDPELRERLGEAGRRRAAEYDRRSTASRVQSIYDAVLPKASW